MVHFQRETTVQPEPRQAGALRAAVAAHFGLASRWVREGVHGVRFRTDREGPR
jgi:hypothetical protein